MKFAIFTVLGSCLYSLESGIKLNKIIFMISTKWSLLSLALLGSGLYLLESGIKPNNIVFIISTKWSLVISRSLGIMFIFIRECY